MNECTRVFLTGFGWLIAPGQSPPGEFLAPKQLANLPVPGLPKPTQFTYAKASAGAEALELLLVHDAFHLGVVVRAEVTSRVKLAFPTAVTVFLDDHATVRSGEAVRIIDGPTNALAIAAVAVDRVAAAWDDSDPLIVGFDGHSCATRLRHDGESWCVDLVDSSGQSV